MDEYPFEKRVFLYWEQGVDRAPDVVKRCIQSWIDWNPGWHVEVLDRASLTRFPDFLDRFDLNRRDIDLQKTAALLRLYLLRTQGGVWVDATVYCTASLDEWLPDHISSGLFAYQDPGPDRVASNWFIAADPNHPILERLDDTFSSHFANNRFWLQNTWLGDRILERIQQRHSASTDATSFWLGWTATKVLRVYPYFIFHFTLNHVVSQPELQHLWRDVPYVPASVPHTLQSCLRRGTPERARTHITGNESWMYKLDWRLDPEDPYWSAVLPYLYTGASA